MDLRSRTNDLGFFIIGNAVIAEARLCRWFCVAVLAFDEPREHRESSAITEKLLRGCCICKYFRGMCYIPSPCGCWILLSLRVMDFLLLLEFMPLLSSDAAS